MITFILLLAATQHLAPIGPSDICSKKEEVLIKPSFEHCLRSKHIFLDTLELEDRSSWKVAPPDVYKVVRWDPKDIVVLTSYSSWFSIHDFKFAMTNLTRNSWVRVNFIFHPADYQKQSRWIISLDKYGNRVFLNDGSAWKIDPEHAKLIQDWSINDFIIYGKNDKYFTGFPFLLINARLNHSVRAAEF